MQSAVGLTLFLAAQACALSAVSLRPCCCLPTVATGCGLRSAAPPHAPHLSRLLAPRMSAPEQQARPPYLLTDLPRPLWRGQMMGWLHATRVWYIIALAYVIAAWKLPTTVPLTGAQLALRAGAAVASSANVLISDGYHNGDQRSGKEGVYGFTAPGETFWLKWDYVGISSVLTSLLWLWSSNLGWAGQLKAVSVAGGIITGLVATLSRFVVPKKIGHTAVKILMAIQFVGLLGYLISLLGSAASACAFNGIIFWVYAPGLILYVLKKPQNQVFGFHEMFHTSVLAGHVISMLCDLRDIASPCARGLCAL